MHMKQVMYKEIYTTYSKVQYAHHPLYYKNKLQTYKFKKGL